MAPRAVAVGLALTALVAAFRDRKADRNEVWCSENNVVDRVKYILTCIENKDYRCATKGYNPRVFKKYHNGKDTKTPIGFTSIFWKMGVKFSTFILDYEITEEMGNYTARFKYVETVIMSDGTEFEKKPSNVYPFNQTFLQHEDAIVQLNPLCRIKWWNQTGIDSEQEAVDDAVDAMMDDKGVACDLKLPRCILR